VLFTVDAFAAAPLSASLSPPRARGLPAINVVSRQYAWAAAPGLYALSHVLLHVRDVPDIFALHSRLGDHTKLGIAYRHVHRGRAIAPPFMATSPLHSMRLGMVVPLVCFVFIALYGAVWQKLEAKDVGQQTA